MNDLLAQLNRVITEAEANNTKAALWEETKRLMGEAGYGPNITPAQIVSLVPNIHGINEIIEASKEVGPADAGPKMPRRKLTPDDEREIADRSATGQSAEQIADQLGLARKSVVAYLERNDV